jgi:hypothetical protein
VAVSGLWALSWNLSEPRRIHFSVSVEQVLAARHASLKML